MTPLSSYGLPCHSPFQVIGVPTIHVELTSVPNMKCLTAAGLVSASHTVSGDAVMVVVALAMRSGVMRSGISRCTSGFRRSKPHVPDVCELPAQSRVQCRHVPFEGGQDARPVRKE